MPEQPEERAKRRMRELSQAVQNAARELDRAYPNTKRSDRIVDDFRQRNKTRSQILTEKYGKPRMGEPFPYNRSRASSDVPVGLILVLLVVIIPLLWIVTCEALK